MIKRKIFQSIFLISIVFSIIFLVNYLAYRHYLRFDISKDNAFSLSAKSIAVTSEINEDIFIYAYFKKEHELTPMLRKLLSSYEFHSKKVIVKWIDPYHDFEILNSLGSLRDNFHKNSILIKSQKKHKFLSAAKLGVYDRKLEMYGIEPELISFNGESAITGTLIDISNTTPSYIAMINNHGERNPNSLEDTGISYFVKHLILEGNKLSLINLLNIKQIPDNIKVLVSVAPKVDFSDHELNLVYEWLNKGGSLFLAIDPLINAQNKKMMTFNLGQLLSKLGIKLGNNIVVDPSKQIPYSRPDNLFVDTYSKHEITQNMTNIPSIFFQSRSLEITNAANVITTPLLATSKKGWGEVDYSNPDYKFDKEKDSKGPVCIAVAALDVKTNGKIVLFGDSDFITNVQIKNQGNLKLIQNSFYWLNDKSKLLKIAPKKSTNIKLQLNRNHLITIFILGVCLLPLFTLIGGVIVWIKRDR